MKSSEITLKIKYSVDEPSKSVIFGFIKNYNSVLRFTYNRLLDGITKTKDLTVEQHKMNHVYIQSHLLNSAQYDAKSIYSSNNTNIIFGGKALFEDRCKNKISRDEFRVRRLRPLCSIGECCKKANRLFKIINENLIVFKPNREIFIELNLKCQGNNYKKKLLQLLSLQNASKIAISYKLDLEYIYLSFDNTVLKQNFYKTKKDRVIAVDLNPNYLGYSVVDWKNEIDYRIIDKGVFDLSDLNKYEATLKVNSNDRKKIYCKNKRDFEVIQIAHRLSKLASHYRCEIFSIEDLSIQSANFHKGRNLNRLINNQWNRTKFVSVLKKLINASSTTLIEVKPEYSSILGNLIYRAEKLPDMILASIELGRRAYEFQNQYLLKIKTKKKNIVLPDLELVKDRINQSMEELNNSMQFDNYAQLFSELKKSKLKYRFLLDFVDKSRVFSKNYLKSYIKLYNFI